MSTPTAIDILRRYASVTTGTFDPASHQTRYTRETVDNPLAGRVLIERYQRRTGDIVQRITSPMGGVVAWRGCIGSVGWAVDPDGTARLLDKREADSECRAGKLFVEPSFSAPAGTALVVAGEVEFAGQRTYRLVTPPAPMIISWYYSSETGLLAGQTIEQGTPLKEVSHLELAAYRTFGGLLVPTRRVIRTNGFDMIQTTEALEWDTVPDDRFVLPPAVRALMPP